MNEGVPEGWCRETISCVARLEYGKSPISVKIESGPYPIIGTSGIVGAASESLWKDQSVVIGRKGTINKPLFVNQPFWAIDTTYFCKFPKTTDPKWFYYKIVDEGLERYNEASGVPSLSRETLNSVSILVPPLPEQKKIASILTSVDEVIESMQKQIDKLQDLKKATMNELLTKGIGHTEFKDSELGRIPKSWEVKKLDDVTIRGSGHTPDKKNPSYWNGGIKWVSLADSSRLDNRLIGSTDKEISDEGLKNSSAVLHPDGTVILSRDAGVGKSAVLLGAMAVSQHFMAWRCGDKMEKWFLYYLLQSLKPLFDAVAIGSTIKTIGLGFFKQMQIVCPPKDEQRRISSILLTIEDHIDHMKQKLTQTQSLKKSLMQDLLTGKVRVKVD